MNYAKEIYEIFNNSKPTELIGNLDTKFTSYEIDDEFIMTTITDEVTPNAYVVSPYALMIDYGEDELEKIDVYWQRAIFSWIIKFFSLVLKSAKIDKTQTLNNYLFATNFFSSKWESLEVGKLREEAISSYPKHALAIRSVNKIQNPNLYENLKKDGWKPITVKQFYLYDSKEKWQKSRNSKNDKKLLNSEQFSFVESDNYTLAIKLYNALYLEKHSEHNLHYREKFLKKMVEKGLLKLFFLQDNDTKKIVGVIGVTEENSVMTVPLIGYDNNYSQKDALYRRLVYHVTAYAFEKGSLLNFSSGAPDFKTKRGATAELDYMFVYDKHLPLYRRMVWQSLYLLSKYIYAPMLVRLKL